jgi:hypothetical protein
MEEVFYFFLLLVKNLQCLSKSFNIRVKREEKDKAIPVTGRGGP